LCYASMEKRVIGSSDLVGRFEFQEEDK